jgi:tRNA threonylcarbamoyladenosine biosynthesis protein TsaB
MNGLLIESSTERGMIAIFDGLKILFHQEMPPGITSSQHLLPAIDALMKKFPLQWKDFQYIATGIGPGSYTGIRVAVTIAKTLAFARQLPLIGIPSLYTFTPSREGAFAALIDAKLGGAYIITGSKQGDTVQYESPPELIELTKLKDSLSPVKTVVTPYAPRLQEKIKDLYPTLTWAWEEKGPDPLQMGKLARQKFEQKEFTLDGQLQILYLRKTQAEIEKMD